MGERTKVKKYLWLIAVILLVLSGCQKTNQTQIAALTTNDKSNPISIDENPYFSWQMQSEEEGQKQSAYQILVSDSEEGLDEGKCIWDSGKVISDQSVAIPYEGISLEEEKKYYWKVKVWDKDKKELVSENATFEVGKLDDVWEETQWITSPSQEITNENSGSTDKDMQAAEISYDFKIEQTEAGFIWGAKESGYGQHYRWSFLAKTDEIKLIISRMDGEQVISSYTTELIDYDLDEFLMKEHNVRIEIQDHAAATYVDDVLVAEEVPVDDCEVGGIGFWAARDEKKAWCDNIVIRNQAGDILWQEDFEEENKIFEPYYIKIEDGWGRVDAGFLVTPGTEAAAPMFRKTFEVPDGKNMVSARLYASALGIYDIYMNGEDINPYYGAPGQSVYSEEVYYQTYDITEQIVEGENAIGILLGHGRYDRARGAWGDQPALYAQIVIRYEDGTRQVIGTDDTWSVCTDGPIRNDDMFNGEYYDANFELADWSCIDYVEEKTGKWNKAVCYDGAEGLKLHAAVDNGVVCVDTLTPVSVSEPVEGTYVYDFGQNFNGICELQLTGKAGDVVTMRYAEYLNTEKLQRKDDEIGTIWTRNLYTADDTDYYIFKEDGTVTYSPTFSYRGFQYLQITGIEEALPVEEVKGLVIATDNERTGYFECSDEDINRLYNTIYWAQLSNYVDVPTDCPQRDERLGWTGDAQVFTYTGALNANTANFMYKYIDALRVSQREDGGYPEIVPFVNTVGSSNGWCDAGIIIVWQMYQQYGNKQIIVENLPSMCKYMDYLVNTSHEYIREEKGYNDHNAVSYPEDACCNTAQCTYAAKLLADMCKIAGEEELYSKYSQVYEAYLEAWQSHFLREDGSIGEWRQSEYAIALAYGLYPKELEAAGAEKLKISIEANDYHVATGYVTTPHVLSILCKYGYVDTAYQVIQKNGYSSWNYMYEMGATALTEGWNTIYVNEDGSVGINGSLNHVGLGSVGQWFYTDILGIRRDENSPAYKHFYLEPQIGGGLTYAKGSYDSVYGKIESAWEITEERMEFHFVIPANTSATVTLPGEAYRQVELEAGTYDFTIDL